MSLCQKPQNHHCLEQQINLDWLRWWAGEKARLSRSRGDPASWYCTEKHPWSLVSAWEWNIPVENLGGGARNAGSLRLKCRIFIVLSTLYQLSVRLWVNNQTLTQSTRQCSGVILGQKMDKLRTAECSNIKAWQWQYWCTWQYCDTWPVLVMASQLTSAIFGGLEFTEAEAAFRPWWDTVEDNLVRGLLLMVGVTESFKRRFSKVIVKSSRTFV